MAPTSFAVVVTGEGAGDVTVGDDGGAAGVGDGTGVADGFGLAGGKDEGGVGAGGLAAMAVDGPPCAPNAVICAVIGLVIAYLLAMLAGICGMLAKFGMLG